MSITYTTTAQFALGYAVNVNATTVADQLQLNPISSPGPMPVLRALVPAVSDGTPLANVGNMVYVDTNTGAILGRYRTMPKNGTGSNSDTVFSNAQTVWVDLYGNAWIGDGLGHAPPASGITGGVITKIGIVIGGTRCDSSGNANANGLYLKPPFTYNSGVFDRDGDGLLRTFNPASETIALPWTNNAHSGNDIGGGTIDAFTSDNDDDAILVLQRLTGAESCGICTQGSSNPVENVWAFTADTINTIPTVQARQVDVIENATGGINNTYSPALYTDGPNGNQGGWCAVVDANDVLWTTTRNGNLVRKQLPSGTATLIIPTNIGTAGASLCIAPDGTVWVWGDRNPDGPTPSSLWHFTAAGVQIGAEIGVYNGLSNRGMCCRYQDGSLWMTGNTELFHCDSTGALTGPNVGFGVGVIKDLTTGTPDQFHYRCVDVDQNGKIWVLQDRIVSGNLTKYSALRINPTTHAVELTIDLMPATGGVSRNTGMTGNARLGVGPPKGFWDVVYDFGSVTQWGTISWHESVPAGSSILVEYRVALTEIALPTMAWATATNGVAFNAPTGRFVECRVTLSAPAGSTNTPGVDAPALLDLTISELVAVTPEVRWSQCGIEYLYRRVGFPDPIPVPEIDWTQAGIEYLYTKATEVRWGQAGIEYLYGLPVAGPPTVGCGTGMVSFYGADRGQAGPLLVAGGGASTFRGAEQGVISCAAGRGGIVSFQGADQGQLACP